MTCQNIRIQLKISDAETAYFFELGVPGDCPRLVDCIQDTIVDPRTFRSALGGLGGGEWRLIDFPGHLELLVQNDKKVEPHMCTTNNKIS